jgi:hypothetical protein
MQDSHFLSVADAELTISMRQDQISRFRTGLKDVDAYRAKLIQRVMQAVFSSKDPNSLPRISLGLSRCSNRK